MGATADMGEAPAAWQTLARLRARRPLVHGIGGPLGLELLADVLLAAGAVPFPAEGEEEVEDAAAAADALVVDLRAPTPRRAAAMQRAAEAALAGGVPWVLAPTGVGVSHYRSELAARLVEVRPAVIRGNAPAVLTLAGEGPGGHGVDAPLDAVEALDAAAQLAQTAGAVVAVTGSVDYATDGRRLVAVADGDAVMARVSGMGCAVSGLVGACLAAEPDPLGAATHALAILGVAGELASVEAQGPGSFRWRLLDALERLDEPTLISKASIEAWTGTVSI